MRRLYVARNEKATTVSRRRGVLSLRRPVRRPWTALVETDDTPTMGTSYLDVAEAVLPPGATFGLVVPFFGAPAAASAAAVVFLGTSYLGPVVRARRAAGRPLLPVSIGRIPWPRILRPARGTPSAARGTPSAAGGSRADRPDDSSAAATPDPRASATPNPPASDPRVETVVLTVPGDRARFAAAVALADRISGTWPALAGQIDVPAAEQVLADALWDIAEGLARRRDLAEVLAGLSRLEFAATPHPEPTVRELHDHLTAARAALAEAETALDVRESDLSRAEEACRALVREAELHAALRAAEQTLRTPPRP